MSGSSTVQVGLVASLAAAGCAGQRVECKDSPTRADLPAPQFKTGYARVNGIRMYYEIHGEVAGAPLVLLPGGGSTIDATYGRILPLFAQHRTVIALEEQGHGRTSDRDAPVRFDTSADDVAALLASLHVERADVMGFSNGASVALHLALRHPALVRKLVFASSITKRAGAAPELWGFMAKADFSTMPQALKDAFLRVNPDPAKLRAMHDKDLERMQHFVDTPDEAVRTVQAPTLVLAADHDVPTPEHALELSRLFPRARLLILPGGHGDYLGEVVASKPGSHDPKLVAGLIDAFLDEE
jgi:pimeloyl-ACP methyl ester carboxylesterase